MGSFTGTYSLPSVFTSAKANNGGPTSIPSRLAISGAITSLVARTGSGLNHPLARIFATPLASALPLSLLGASTAAPPFAFAFPIRP